MFLQIIIVWVRDKKIILQSDLCKIRRLYQFQMITSLTNKNGVWGARCGLYDHLHLLSLATEF